MTPVRRSFEFQNARLPAARMLHLKNSNSADPAGSPRTISMSAGAQYIVGEGAGRGSAHSLPPQRTHPPAAVVPASPNRPPCDARRSGCAEHPHEALDLLPGTRSVGIQICFYANPGEEYRNEVADDIDIHLGIFGSDVSLQQALELGATIDDHFACLRRQARELAHRVHREASLLIERATRRLLEELLDIVPAKRLGGQQCAAAAGIQIISEAGQEELFLARELRIEARLVHAGGALELRQRRAGKPVFPEDRQGLLQHALAAEFSRSSHVPLYRILN